MRRQRIRLERTKHRGYVFTSYTIDRVKLLEKASKYCVFAVIGSEICPSTGKFHYQGYFYLKEPRSEGRVRKLLDYSHIEPANKCPATNFLYCSKSGVYTTTGSMLSALKQYDADLKNPPLPKIQKITKKVEGGLGGVLLKSDIYNIFRI